MMIHFFCSGMYVQQIFLVGTGNLILMTLHRLVTYVVTSSLSDGTQYMHSTHTIRLLFTTCIVNFTFNLVDFLACSHDELGL